MSQRIKKAGRRYKIEMFSAMAAYVVVLVVSLTIARGMEPGPTLTLLALAPIAPMVFAFFAFWRFYVRMDEMQKRITADAAALTLVVGIFTALTLGFLKRFGVMDIESDMIWLVPFLIVVWGGVRFFLGGRDC